VQGPPRHPRRKSKQRRLPSVITEFELLLGFRVFLEAVLRFIIMSLLAQPHVVPPEQIQAFLRDGVAVVPGVLSPDEVAAARAGLAATLRRRAAVEHAPSTERPPTAGATTRARDALVASAHGLARLSTTNGAGGVLDVFFEVSPYLNASTGALSPPPGISSPPQRAHIA